MLMSLVVTSFLVNLEFYLHLMGLAMCKEKELRDNSCMHCTDDFDFVNRVENGTIAAVIMKNTSHFILTFEGSKDFGDWNLNTQIGQSKPTFIKNATTDIKVHSGWLNGYLKIRQSLWESVDDIKMKLVIVGHSMGGSLATIAASDFSTIFDVQLITAESPRVGNKQFVDIVENQVDTIYRITNMNDIVPLLPGRNFNYVHTKNEIWINGNKTVYCPEAEDLKCIASTWPYNNMNHHAIILNILVGGCL